MKKIAIFASGTGSNALKIIEHFKDKDVATVALVVSNKSKAAVLDKAKANNIETLIIKRTTFYDTKEVLTLFKEKGIDFVVLAGFLWLMPRYLVKAYKEKMVNIHPALLPKYGGKGMYGMNVHKAVHAAKEAITGITIHYVNEHYDEGSVVFQASCKVIATDTPEDISMKVRALEHQYFPQIIEELIEEFDRYS